MNSRRDNQQEQLEGPSVRLGTQMPTRSEWVEGEGSYLPSLSLESLSIGLSYYNYASTILFYALLVIAGCQA